MHGVATGTRSPAMIIDKCDTMESPRQLVRVRDSTDEGEGAEGCHSAGNAAASPTGHSSITSNDRN